MSIYLQWAIGCAGAYLLGSIPFGFLVAKVRGLDIRQLGSGNIGATNVFRCVSKPLGILTFLLDLGKGVAGCCLIPCLAAHAMQGGVSTGMPFRVACGFLTVAGHNWTVFLGFKGGKGIATSAGLLLGLAPAGCGVALLVWIVTFLLTRYVSVASIAAAVALGIVSWPLYLTRYDWWFPVMLDALAALAIARHHGNIRRLCAGTESRFKFKRRLG
jgi:glycerol-3-phosphate acyltransferase PlsY